MKYPFTFLILLLTWITITACRDNDAEPENEHLNSFSMTVNGGAWEPSTIDACTKTFMCAMSKLNNVPYYNITAYRDPGANTSVQSENFLDVQIMDVTDTGVYAITGSRDENFTSFAIYHVNDGTNGRKTYRNKREGNSFQVEITEFLPVTGSVSPVGIKGSFSGTLYNADNAQDSLLISNGEFVFRKTNFYNFNQCKP